MADDDEIRESLCAPLGSLILGTELRSHRQSFGSTTNRQSFGSYRASLSPATPRLARESSGGGSLLTPSPQSYRFWYGKRSSARRPGELTEAGEGEGVEDEGEAEARAQAQAEAIEMQRIYEQIFHVRELRCLEGLVPGVCLELESYAQAELELFNEEDLKLSEEMSAACDGGVREATGGGGDGGVGGGGESGRKRRLEVAVRAGVGTARRALWRGRTDGWR